MKNRLLYIAPWQATFIQKDIDLLSTHFDVVVPKHNWSSKWMLPFTFIQQFFYLIGTVPSAQVVVVMFGGYWSFFPALISKMYGKRCCIVLGGMDCVSFPQLHYGSLRKPLLKWFVGYSYTWASRLLPVHESLVSSINTYISESNYSYQGFQHHFPTIKTPFTVIHNGFSVPEFEHESCEKIPNSFILIAAADNLMRIRLKGIVPILDLAPRFPNCSFTIIGINPELTRQWTMPANVTCLGFMGQEEFRSILTKSQFVLQPSLSEGFPNAICEAMLVGCIPIGSTVGAIPLIIENTGILVQHEDDLEDAIRSAMLLGESDKARLAQAARKRISSNFPMERRQKELVSVLN